MGGNVHRPSTISTGKLVTNCHVTLPAPCRYGTPRHHVQFLRHKLRWSPTAQRVSTMRMRTLRTKCLKTAMDDNSAAANENQEDYYRQDYEHAASEVHAIHNATSSPHATRWLVYWFSSLQVMIAESTDPRLTLDHLSAEWAMFCIGRLLRRHRLLLFA